MMDPSSMMGGLPGMGGGGGGGGDAPRATNVPDYSPSFNKYAAGVDALAPSYDYYINQGQNAGNLSYDQYVEMLKNPNAIQDMIAKGYQESPYRKMMLDRLTQRMNLNAANNGMLTSPAYQNALNNELMGMSGQFQNEYINRGLGLFGQGLGGLDNRNNLGFMGTGEKNSLLERALAARLKGDMSAQDAAMAEAGLDESEGADWLGLGLGAVGGIIGGIYGGPMGASAGFGIGSSVGGMFSGKGGGGKKGGGGGMGGGGGGFNPMSMFGGGGGGGTYNMQNATPGGMSGTGQLPLPFS